MKQQPAYVLSSAGIMAGFSYLMGACLAFQVVTLPLNPAFWKEDGVRDHLPDVRLEPFAGGTIARRSV